MNRVAVQAVCMAGLLSVAITLNPTVWAKGPKEEIRPSPLFVDPAFNFGRIDSICLAPIMDLRSDKTAHIFLRGKTPSVDFVHVPSAEGILSGNLAWLGYAPSWCNPVDATSNDLAKPSDAWLRSLNFGQSKWLFIVAVDALSATKNANTGVHPMGLGVRSGFVAEHAVVSGYLFEKTMDSAKLVWRDRELGLDHSGGVIGLTSADVYSTGAVNSPVQNLVWKFDPHSKKRPLVRFASTEEDFNATCDAVWDALRGALAEDTDKYEVALLDPTDKLALYTVKYNSLMPHFRGDEGGNEERIALKGDTGSCRLQFTQPFRTSGQDDWGDLMERVRVLVSK